MKIKTYLLTCALGILAFTAPLQAQETTPTQSAVLAEELLMLLDIDKNMDATMQQISKMQEQSMDSTNATPEVREKQKKLRDAINAEVKALVSWDVIKPMFISIYSEAFTPEELQGMITFYKTPVGQKWLEKQPQIQLATMQKMQTVMMEAQPKIQAAIKRAMETQKESK